MAQEIAIARPRSPITRKRSKFEWGQLFLHLVMFFLLFCMAYPLFMAVWCAFKTQALYEESKFYPSFPMKISNLAVAWNAVSGYMYNTVAVAIIGIPLALLFASMAAYAFAIMSFPGKNFFFMLVICLMMVPGILTLVPQFLMYKSMGLTNSLFSILLPVLTTSPVSAVFLLTLFFKALPKELFEAARIDGCGEFRVFTKVAIPLCMPILITEAIMMINGLWNDYIWPMTVISTNTEALTISAGLILEFRDAYSQNMPVTYAGYLISSLPLLVLFIAGNKYYIQGLLNSGIKM